jgi:hypothetical protein
MWFSTTLSSFILHLNNSSGQQMVQLQDSISECLHHNTFSNMFFNKISKADCAWILSCFGLEVNAWFIIQLVLSSPIFSTSFHTWLGSHLSIASIHRCMCIHPINLMGIHLLHYVYVNEHIRTHDVVHHTFVTIAWDANFHVGWKQLHAFPSTHSTLLINELTLCLAKMAFAH